MRKKVTELDENEKAEFEEFMRENGYEVHQIEEEGILKCYNIVNHSIGYCLNIGEIKRIPEDSAYALYLHKSEE